MVDNRKWEPTREGEREKKEKLPEKKKQKKREKKKPCLTDGCAIYSIQHSLGSFLNLRIHQEFDTIYK